MRSRALAVLVAVAMTAAACADRGRPDRGASSSSAPTSTTSVAAPAPPGPLRVAWLYVGDRTIPGWAASHDEGRRAVEQAFGERVVTSVREYVDETDEAAAAIDELVRAGTTMIFATAYGLGEVVHAAARRHPNVRFALVRGSKPEDNVGVYSGAGEQTMYLAGMAAGAATRSGTIGFVAPFPYPELVRHIDAYTLGARAVNPTAQVRVGFVNSWWDTAGEARTAATLVAAGADVLAQEGDSTATGEAARAAGVAWTGYDSDQSAVHPDGWLTAPVYDWRGYYVEQVRAALAGTWRAGAYYGGIGDGFTRLAPYGARVTPATRARIDATAARMADGTFDLFAGPLVDRSGVERVAAGRTLSADQRTALDWFVAGVVGDEATSATVRPEPTSSMGTYRSGG